MVIRRTFAQRKVLELYKRIEEISYPIQPEKLLPYLPKSTKIMTYQQMAEITGCSAKDIAIMCDSSSGATHLNVENNKCLILYNASMNSGRSLWTQCHEIAHICMNHLDFMEGSKIADMGGVEPYNQFEIEADYFAWNLIAPLPIMREMGITTIAEIKDIFGMSKQAAALQFDRYSKWCHNHIKTAWENNMLREFRSKYRGS